MEERKERLLLYRSMLPRGYMKFIAHKVGVTPMSVSHFLKGRNESYKIENAILDTIADLKKERAEKLKAAGLR